MRRIQFDFIDGLRALLALYIVAHHVLQFLGRYPHGLGVFAYGQPVVAMFLTVSGFCLALPQASSGVWTVDARSFFRRRARRILPPYYAALVLAILVNFGFKLLGPFRDPLGNFSFFSVWSHVLLIQNWFIEQMFTLDGPLWSIALECQMYLLFPLIVFLRRKWSWYGLLMSSIVFSLGAFHRFHNIGKLHFLLYFALGVLSAELAFRRKQPWLTLGTMAVVTCTDLVIPHPSIPQQEVFASLACAALLAHLSHEQDNIARRVLGWRPLAWFGTFSYSIYLLHDVFLQIAWYWVRDREAGFASRFDWQFVTFMLPVSAVAVTASFGFHVLFERPFMSNKRLKAEQRLAAV